MAQDFAAAFGVGEDNTHISTVDADVAGGALVDHDDRPGRSAHALEIDAHLAEALVAARGNRRDLPRRSTLARPYLDPLEGALAAQLVRAADA